MSLVVLLVQVFILKITSNVEAQYMPPMGGMQYPPMPQMPMGMAPPMQPMQMPPPMPMPGMGMPMMMSQKLPMVVMPYHSKKQDIKYGKEDKKDSKKDSKKNKKSKKDRKRKKRKKYASSSSGESDDSSSSGSDVSAANFRTMKKKLKRSFRRNSKRRQVLTPVISYLTKDGYVVYQKKIKKNKAKDWLEMGNRSPNTHNDDISANEETLRKVLRKEIEKMKHKRN